MYSISHAGVDIAVCVAVDTIRNPWGDVAEQFAVTPGSIFFNCKAVAASFQLVPATVTELTNRDETHIDAGAEKLYP